MKEVEKLQLRLVAIHYAAVGTLIFSFADMNNEILPAYEPGAHLTLHLPNGLIRQYSLVYPYAMGRTYDIGVKLDPETRGGSGFMHEQLRVGATLVAEVPRNNFPLVASVRHSLFIAGGIGITPIFCMLQALELTTSEWQLFYGARRREEAAFLDEITKLKGKSVFRASDVEPSQRFDLKAIFMAAPEGTHLYCCGPSSMLESFRDATSTFAPENVHFEHFAATLPGDDIGGFTVELAKSGRCIEVAKGESIARALMRNGLDANVSCEQGHCGACETGLVSGIADHRDSVLTDKERHSMKTVMICCSGSKTERLVLAL